MYESTKSVYWSGLYKVTGVYIEQPLAIAFANISYISANIILTSLAAFICVPVIILKELKRRLNAMNKNKNNSLMHLSLELEKWRRHHDLTCSLIDSINDCFGPCLLIFLIFVTITLVRNPSAIINEYLQLKNSDVIESSFLGLFFVSIHFFVILYPAQMLRKEVIKKYYLHTLI